MMQWDRLTLGRMAEKELGFQRYAGEGMPFGGCIEILESDELLSRGIALKAVQPSILLFLICQGFLLCCDIT